MSEQEFPEILEKTIRSFNKYNVDYLVIGGVAVNFYGYHRESRKLDSGIDFDIDIWYKPITSNYYNLVKSIKELDISTDDRVKNLVFKPNSTFLRLRKDNFQLELLPHIKGFGIKSFNQCYQRRVVQSIDGTETFVSVIHLDDLIQNKESLLREVDKEDLEQLYKIRRNLLGE